MPLCWRFTTALTYAAAVSPGLLFKPFVPMKPERRIALVRKLRKLIYDFESLNAPKVCEKLDVPMKELLKWSEKTDAPKHQTKCNTLMHVAENNSYFLRDFLLAIHMFISAGRD
ncbi:hypothetical protein AVEN_110301-1 [Araneus ventricosus]|uniref:Uncharacterized protein n=1 Tax=Araneus ventricosus TaxID=182803 RepID=A0A4Y2GRV9_ARAVE|nr:hypothetical protein AVEN_110301-1 [Araneus ventricosus]